MMARHPFLRKFAALTGEYVNTIGQCDIDVFEVTLTKLYEARVQRDGRNWIESLCYDQPTHSQVQDAWSMYRKVLVYSPVIDAPCLSSYARELLATLVAIKRAETNAPFTLEGTRTVFHSIVTDVLQQYGVNQKSFTAITLLNALLVGPEAHLQMHGHYPVNEKALCLAVANGEPLVHF
jgi:hypothetical protein